jgi:hypothetical protein
MVEQWRYAVAARPDTCFLGLPKVSDDAPAIGEQHRAPGFVAGAVTAHDAQRRSATAWRTRLSWVQTSRSSISGAGWLNGRSPLNHIAL